MASQLYPEEGRGNHIRIAEIAAVVYWWHLEPEERASKTQRATELYQQGVNPKHIAAMLQMPEAQVIAYVKVPKGIRAKHEQTGLELD